MNRTNSIGKAEKTESLRNSLIMAGYDMAASQAKDMSEDEDYWGSYMIDGKIKAHPTFRVIRQSCRA